MSDLHRSPEALPQLFERKLPLEEHSFEHELLGREVREGCACRAGDSGSVFPLLVAQRRAVGVRYARLSLEFVDCHAEHHVRLRGGLCLAVGPMSSAASRA